MKRKMTLRISLLLLIYLFVAFFILSIAARVITGVVYSGEIYLLSGEIIQSAKMSFVAGALGTLVAFIFNKIDEYNAHKNPPTEPDK
jgi:hypothetical protein